MISLVRRGLNRAKDLLFLPMLDDFWWSRRRQTVTALVYHRVGDSDETAFLTAGGSPVIEPEMLRRELTFLKERGARFLTFNDLREGRFPGPDEVGFVVTFDDCFKGDYDNGLPVLDALGIDAVFFQSSAMIDAPTLIWEHALYWYADRTDRRDAFEKLARSRFPNMPDRDGVDSDWLSWLRDRVPIVELDKLLDAAIEQIGGAEEMRQLATGIYPSTADLERAAAAGHEIGSHGHRHLRRDAIDISTFEDDLAESVSTLAEIIGDRPRAFSYPFSSLFDDDDEITGRYFAQAAVVDGLAITRLTPPLRLSRCTWPGVQPTGARERRWLLTGAV